MPIVSDERLARPRQGSATADQQTHMRTRGRPRKDPDRLTPGMLRVLAAKEADPHLTLGEAAFKVGLRQGSAKKWREKRVERRDAAEFWRRWCKLDRVAEGGPPNPGPFQTFRSSHLNAPTINPYTGRQAMTGVTWPYMEEVCDALDDPTVTRLLIILPVRFAKTTLCEQKIVHDYCENPDSQVLYICSNLKHLRERSYNIQRILTDDVTYPSLHHEWGPWIGKPDDSSKPWTQTSFYVRGRKSPERAPSFSGYGITAKVYGARGDRIYLDDVDDPGNGPDERDTIMRAINGPIASRLNPGGKIVYIGTRCGVDDVPSRLMKLKGWKVIVLSALGEDGESICPEMYTTEELLEFRLTHGDEMFSLMMLNDPAPEGTLLFPPLLVDSSKGSYDIGDAPAHWERIIAVDPASRGQAAVVTVAHYEGIVRVIDAATRRAPNTDQVFEMIQHAVYAHKPARCIIEESGATFFTEIPAIQRFLADENVRMVRFKTTKERNDPRYGIPQIASWMSLGKLSLAWGSDAAAERMSSLAREMIGFSPDMRQQKSHHYDQLMALWFCTNVISKDRNAGQSTRAGRPVDRLVTSRPFLSSPLTPTYPPGVPYAHGRPGR